MAEPCPKESEHTQYAHVDLGQGAWAHFRRKLDHSQKQQIQIAELAADYETRNAAEITLGMIGMSLMTAPEEWRKGYVDGDGSIREPQYEPMMALVKGFLDEYELRQESALASPDKREQMATARLRYFTACAETFFIEGSWGAQYPPTDGTVSEIVELKAMRAWNRWKREYNARLKAAGVDSENDSTTPS